jgi:hypothetical protein
MRTGAPISTRRSRNDPSPPPYRSSYTSFIPRAPTANSRSGLDRPSDTRQQESSDLPTILEDLQRLFGTRIVPDSTPSSAASLTNQGTSVPRSTSTPISPVPFSLSSTSTVRRSSTSSSNLDSNQPDTARSSSMGTSEVEDGE